VITRRSSKSNTPLGMATFAVAVRIDVGAPTEYDPIQRVERLVGRAPGGRKHDRPPSDLGYATRIRAGH
jgi:hypothetical protein